MSPILETLLAELRKGPQPARELAKALGRSACATQAQLRQLRKLGLADRLMRSAWTVWCVPEAMETARQAAEAAKVRAAEIEREKSAKRSAAQHLRKLAEAAAKKAAIAAKEEAEAELWARHPVRKIVPASKCPLPKIGVRSVFELAAA